MFLVSPARQGWMDGSNNHASTFRLKTSGTWLGPGIRRLSKPWIFAKLKHDDDDDDEILPFDSLKTYPGTKQREFLRFII
jgi:hypothetical protein